jgi:hypothetical protein
MARKCMIKLMLVMMESIVLIIFEVHANELTPLSFAPTPLPINIHPFHLDDENISYIDRCIERTLKKCEEQHHNQLCVAVNLTLSLFKDPMHPKDYPTNFLYVIGKCSYDCVVDSEHVGIHYASCIANCYEKLMTKP